MTIPGAFKILGHKDGLYYYLPKETMQVVSLRAREHTKGNLIAIAPLDFWIARYGNRFGIPWDRVQDNLIRSQHKHGAYVPKICDRK